MIRPFLSEVDFACEVFQDTQTFHNLSGLLQFTTRSEQEVNITLTTHIGDIALCQIVTIGGGGGWVGITPPLLEIDAAGGVLAHITTMSVLVQTFWRHQICNIY